MQLHGRRFLFRPGGVWTSSPAARHASENLPNSFHAASVSAGPAIAFVTRVPLPARRLSSAITRSRVQG